MPNDLFVIPTATHRAAIRAAAAGGTGGEPADESAHIVGGEEVGHRARAFAPIR